MQMVEGRSVFQELLHKLSTLQINPWSVVAGIISLGILLKIFRLLFALLWWLAILAGIFYFFEHASR